LPLEADYRNTHFSASTDRTLLVCTADVINEMHANGHRYPMLLVNLPAGTRVIWDAGYVGMDKIYPEFGVVTPFKRKKGQDLSEEQREFNHQVSKVRIVVKNVICRMKVFRVLGDFFRNSDSVHGVMAGVVSGLVNLRTINRLAVVA
jgi:hypothetical protein